MGQIFLGKWWHWLVLIAIVVVMWWAGNEKMHVISFNPFLFLLLGVTTVAVLILLAGSRPGEQVTRDDLSEAATSQSQPTAD